MQRFCDSLHIRAVAHVGWVEHSQGCGTDSYGVLVTASDEKSGQGQTKVNIKEHSKG